MNVRLLRSALLLVLGFALSPSPAPAEFRLPRVFSDHMVLQRDAPLPIWGWANAGEKVTVRFADQEKSATADPAGRWQVALDALPASAEPRVLTVQVETQDAPTAIKDVLVGEVWLCSGQSNMEWTVAQSANPQAEIAAGNHPRIRHIKIPHTPAAKPQDEVPTEGWQVCSPQTVPRFTAVGYYFARQLQEKLDVPVGLIGSNWGGTRIEPWIPPEGFRSVEALRDIAQNLDRFPQTKGDKVMHQSALALYNGMIHPLVPYAIRGALWYQGESNNGEGMLYHEKMKALIQGWRAVWKQGDFPFLFVQLAPFRYGGPRGNPASLPGIWQAQAATLALPHTGMAVTTDIGNVRDIHPKNKQEVGRRLALWALAKTYGHPNLVYSGPLYKSHTVENNAIRIAFDHADGLRSADGMSLSHFEVAGEDRTFLPAAARIDGSTILVSGVPKPVAVRFAWHQEAEPNLVNAAGLPAAPFRTDDW
ncbi:MAG: 9-O-acetylesterase [Planctomycetales bacterium]|nr:9-O-acetylesterase [Planctomycetales bacterium]